VKKLTIILTLALMIPALALTSAAGTKGDVSGVTAQDPDVFTHRDAGVQFQLPKGWKAKPDGEVITASSADDALQVVFWVPDENTFAAAVKELDKELSKTIKNMKTEGKPSEDTLNGMAHYGETGTGEVNGAVIVWSVDVLGAKKPLMVLTFAAPQLFEKNADAYEKLLASIKKTN
jgi:hypothetical protein